MPLDDRQVLPDPADLRRLADVLLDDHMGRCALLVQILLDPGGCRGHVHDQEAELGEVRSEHANRGERSARSCSSPDSMTSRSMAPPRSIFPSTVPISARSSAAAADPAAGPCRSRRPTPARSRAAKPRVPLLGAQPVDRLDDDVGQDAAADRRQHADAGDRGSTGDPDGDQGAERGRAQRGQQSRPGDPAQVGPGAADPRPRAGSHQPGFVGVFPDLPRPCGSFLPDIAGYISSNTLSSGTAAEHGDAPVPGDTGASALSRYGPRAISGNRARGWRDFHGGPVGAGVSADFSRPLPGMRRSGTPGRHVTPCWRREFLEVPGLGGAARPGCRATRYSSPTVPLLARGHGGLASAPAGQDRSGSRRPAWGQTNSPYSQVCVVLMPRLPGARYSSPALPSLRRVAVASPRPCRSGSFRKIAASFAPSGLGNSRDSQVGVRVRAQAAGHQVEQSHAAVAAQGRGGLAASLPVRLVQEDNRVVFPVRPRARKLPELP